LTIKFTRHTTASPPELSSRAEHDRSLANDHAKSRDLHFFRSLFSTKPPRTSQILWASSCSSHALRSQPSAFSSQKIVVGRPSSVVGKIELANDERPRTNDEFLLKADS